MTQDVAGHDIAAGRAHVAEEVHESGRGCRRPFSRQVGRRRADEEDLRPEDAEADDHEQHDDAGRTCPRRRVVDERQAGQARQSKQTTGARRPPKSRSLAQPER